MKRLFGVLAGALLLIAVPVVAHGQEKGKGGEKGKKKGEAAGPAPKYKREKPPKLKAMYDTTVRQQMMKEFNYSTVMQVPTSAPAALTTFSSIIVLPKSFAPQCSASRARSAP